MEDHEKDAIRDAGREHLLPGAALPIDEYEYLEDSAEGRWGRKWSDVCPACKGYDQEHTLDENCLVDAQ